MLVQVRETEYYVDSSVWNAAFNKHAPDLLRHTTAFFAAARARQDVHLYLSDVAIEEITNAPPTRATEVVALINEAMADSLDLDDEAEALVDAYVEHGVLTSGHLVDARPTGDVR